MPRKKTESAVAEIETPEIESEIDAIKEEARHEQKAVDIARRKGIKIEEAREHVRKPRSEVEEETERAIAQGAEGRRIVEKIDATAEDASEKIGRTLKLAAPFPIEVVNVWRVEHGRVYKFEIRDKKSGHVASGSVLYSEFARQYRDEPKNLGKWFCGIVEDGLGKEHRR